MQAELAVVLAATDVIAVSKKFIMLPENVGDKASQRNVSVEVDVVAQGGHAWLEVKAYPPFGLESLHFAGMQQQAALQVQVARAACNARRWRPPSVVYHFVEGVDTQVKAELQALGIIVSGPGSGLSASSIGGRAWIKRRGSHCDPSLNPI
ncbi:hypothetical protein WJX72_002633 [[Myrmecia] bisecta]|uniref:Uncharacterized protein n=1 Tax=[Myrmecia] bisecta TaxID=41462 RepID=A0AAW1P4W9_9CHLO